MSRHSHSLLVPLLAAAVATVGCTPHSTPAAATAPTKPTGQAAPLPAPPAPRLSQAERDMIDQLTMALYVNDFEVRRLAAEELGRLGSDARGALPELIQCAAATGDDEPVASCAHSIVLIADVSDTYALKALVHNFQLPLEVKEAALSALGDLGGLATAPIAAIYLDACERQATASSIAGRKHLQQTAQFALGELARSPASARRYLGEERHGDCGVRGADAVSAIAQR